MCRMANKLCCSRFVPKPPLALTRRVVPCAVPARSSHPTFVLSVMHPYRTKTCGELRKENVGQTVRLSGWVHRVRDLGGVLFIDLRDHYGITQCVVDPDSPAFSTAEKLRSEWVVRIEGDVRVRPEGTDNAELPTGKVEVYVRDIEVLGRSA